MRIAFFTARLIYGGGEKVQNWLAHKLVDAGIEVAYFAPIIDDEYVSKLKKVQLYGVVDTIQYPLSLKKHHPVVFFNEMKRLYKENKLDAILIFGGSLIEQWAAKSLGIKVILAERCNPKWRSFPSQILKQIQYRCADGYVFQTKEQSECYSRFAQQHCAIILNPIIDERLLPTAPLRKEIVTVGRLSEEKNIMGVLNAFSVFHKTHPEYRLVMYGSGPQENKLLKRAEELEIGNSVQIVKGKTNIPELIEGASLFVFNSTNEGMPNALIEAMSVGLACISTDCPIYGARAIVHDGVNGSLIPVGDDKALCEKMCEIIDDPVLADKYRYESLKIREELAQDKIAKQWIDYLENLLNC